MCSVGQNQITSIAGSTPASTMLGASAVGASFAGRGARRVLSGTFLGGKTSAAPAPADTPRDTLPRNPGSSTPVNQMEY